MSAKKRGLGASRMAAGTRTNVEDLVDRVAGPSPGTQEIPVDAIRPSPFQARLEIEAEELEELAASIREQGLLQPILVRPLGDGYELLAGERRWRAFQHLGQERIPAQVRHVDDVTASLVGAIENAQRANLGAWEEAQSVATVREELEKAGRPATGAAIAELFGWSAAKVSERLTIIDAFPEHFLEDEGIELHAVKKVPKAALLRASRAPSDAKRIAALRRAVALAAAGEPAGKVSARGRPSAGYTMTRRKDGSAIFRLRRPPSELDPEEARAALDRLEPMLRELRRRAE